MKIIAENEKLIPVRMKSGDVGYDLRSNYTLQVNRGETVKIGTGVKIELPDSIEAQVRPRSGFNAKGILTHFGTIDPNYRGEICVILTNLSNEILTINRFDRIAQLVFAKYESVAFELCAKLNQSNRGENGFGHSGIN